MRVSLLFVAALALVACVGVTVSAKGHAHHRHAAASPKSVGDHASSTEHAATTWLLDASVVNQGSSQIAEADAKGDWALYKQCDGAWGSDRIGTSSKTICQVGCAMSSVAMALKTKGTDVNPGTLNKWLIAHGGYADGDELVWGSVTAFGSISLYNYYHGAGSLSQSDLQSVLAKGWAVVVNVRAGTHWVLVTGSAGGDTYRVNDPGFATTSYTYGDMGNFVVYS